MKINKWALSFILSAVCLGSATITNKEVVSMEKANAAAANEITPRLIVSKYQSDDDIIADIVLTEAPYYADKTGKIDISDCLKLAIADVKAAGGGTVFLPAGNYRLTSSITLPNYVTIMGEYNDPDTCAGNYGTIILADVPSTTEDLPGLFRLTGSSGVYGLTVYYPGQTIEKVRPYPYTFEIMGGAFSILEHAQFTIKNVTLINSYKGVAASRTVNPNVAIGMQDAHEGLVIENLKGSPLKYGINAVNESDIGYYKNINFNPTYWANFNYKNRLVLASQVRDYTYTHSAGLLLGDLEWSPYYDISVSGYMVGVHIIKGTRVQPANPIAFMGGFYDLLIKDAKYGLLVDDLYSKWGMLVTNGTIEAEKIAVANNATYGYVRLTAVTTKGGISGERVFKNSAIIPENIVVTTPQYRHKHTSFYDAYKNFGVAKDGYSDCSLYLQNALNTASANGGGIVYLRAGYYKVTRAITIPDNVELRGCMPITNRDNLGNSAGTVVFSYYDAQSSSPLTDKALFTLNENSGISGLRIVYPNNNLVLSGTGAYSIKQTPFTIRLTKDHGYVTNVGLVDSYNGIQVDTANDCVIKDVPALFFDIGISVVSSANTHIENVFSNATIATQSGFNTQFPDLFTGSWLWRVNNLWNYYTYTETHTKILEISSSSNVNIMSVFTFCSSRILSAVSSSVTMNGCGADRMYRQGLVAKLDNSTLTMINQLKYNCYMYELGGASIISIYGRMDLKLASDFADVDYNVEANQIIKDADLDADTLFPGLSYPEDEDYQDEAQDNDPFANIIGEIK